MNLEIHLLNREVLSNPTMCTREEAASSHLGYRTTRLTLYAKASFCTKAKVVLPGSALEGLLQEASWWHCHYTSDRGNTNTGEIAVGGENRSTAYQSGRKRSLQINPADSRKKFTMLFN